jgi:hypothetical protein
MTVFRNPVSYSIFVLFFTLVILSYGESPLVVLQHLIFPYTVDISDGVGSVGATIFRAVTFVLQFLVAGSVALVVKSKTASTRVLLSITGVVLVVVYFLVVVLGYIAPRLH